MYRIRRSARGGGGGGGDGHKNCVESSLLLPRAWMGRKTSTKAERREITEAAAAAGPPHR